MSSEPPPNPITSNFNLRAWIYTSSGSGGLTETKANALYLSKQINDTSIGKPTFIVGTYANDYDINEAAQLFTIAQSATIETLIHIANDQVQATDLYNVNINRINLVGNRYSAPNIATWDDYAIFTPTLVGEYLEVIGPSITPTLNTNSFYPAASHPFAVTNQGQYNMKVTFQITGSAITGTSGVIAFGISTSSSAVTNWLYANNGNLTGSLSRNHVQNLATADLPMIYNIDFNFIAVGSNYYFKYYFQAGSLTSGSLIMSYYITKLC